MVVPQHTAMKIDVNIADLNNNMPFIMESLPLGFGINVVEGVLNSEQRCLWIENHRNMPITLSKNLVIGHAYEWGGVYTVEEGSTVGKQPEVETIEEGELKDVRIGSALNKKQKK